MATPSIYAINAQCLGGELVDNKKEKGATGASMLHGSRETMDSNESPTQAEQRSKEETNDLLNQDMDDLEFESKMTHINFCFKNRGLQECIEVLG